MTHNWYPSLAHDHGDLRQELEGFVRALGTEAVPPAGSPFYDILAHAGDYFERELPHHVEEEEQVLYPRVAELVKPGDMARLREQHAALLVMAPMFTRQRRAFMADPSPQAWLELRHIGDRLVAAMRRHLEFEEALLIHALRARGD